MISKILKWCWAKKWFLLPALVAVPLLLVKFLGGVGRLLSPPSAAASAPALSHADAERERERIKEHAEAARTAAEKRADALQDKLDNFLERK